MSNDVLELEIMRLRGKYFFSPKDEFKDLDLNNFNSIIESFDHRIEGWYFKPLGKLLGDESTCAFSF